jgi:Zn-dependent M28 family amino/carboxypeptidase
MPPLTEQETALCSSLRRDVEKLASEIGERNLTRYRNLTAAADFLEDSFVDAGWEVSCHSYEIGEKRCHNLEVEIKGSERGDEIVVVGAHYDSVDGSPGANDNATGTAAVLALSRLFARRRTSRTLRLLEFVNEEPPYFQSSHMGSLIYARHCRKRGDNIVAMLSLETIGYYTDEKGSQNYPFPLGLFYPSTGNFIAFVGNISSRELVRDVVASFRHHAKYPSEGGAIPGFMPGIGLSDHWAFWKQGYPAIMVTDTAPFRYPYYHTEADTLDRVRYDRMARVVAGLKGVIADLAGLIGEEFRSSG